MNYLDYAGLQRYNELLKSNYIGDKSTLKTTQKSTLVAAINELKDIMPDGSNKIDKVASAVEGNFPSLNASGALVDSGKKASDFKISISTAATTTGALKTYTITQGVTKIGVIDIPKDLVVSSGSIEVNPAGQTPGTYLKLVIANQSAPVYINVADLVDAYTAKAGATQVQLSISASNEISASIVAGSIRSTELASNAVTSDKILAGAVTEAKLDTNLLNTINSALQGTPIPLEGSNSVASLFA